MSDLDIDKIEREWTGGDYAISPSTVDDLIAEVKRLRAGAPSPSETKLRDHFAGLAMQSLANSLELEPGEQRYESDVLETVARDAYDIADAMMAERKRRGV